MTLEAFFAVVLGAAFLGEGLAATQLVGGVAILVAAGVVAVARSPARPREAPHLAGVVEGVATR